MKASKVASWALVALVGLITWTTQVPANAQQAGAAFTGGEETRRNADVQEQSLADALRPDRRAAGTKRIEDCGTIWLCAAISGG